MITLRPGTTSRTASPESRVWSAASEVRSTALDSGLRTPHFAPLFLVPCRAPRATSHAWRRAFLAAALCLGAARAWCAGSPFAAQLPEFNLQDPAGAAHGRNELLANGAVIVVTIPNVKHGEFQERWVRFLKKYLPAGGPRLVILEDLSQSNVRERAVQGLKKSYEPGQPTLVLNDPEGQFRRALRVPCDETAVLVFDREGRLVHAVSGLEAPDDVIEAARQAGKLVTRLWSAAPKANATPQAGGKSGDGLAEK